MQLCAELRQTTESLKAEYFISSIASTANNARRRLLLGGDSRWNHARIRWRCTLAPAGENVVMICAAALRAVTTITADTCL